jgi:hypothetical protein
MNENIKIKNRVLVTYCLFSIRVLLTTVLLFSCRKFVEIAIPKTQITTPAVYTDDATAISAIRGIYSKMMEGDFARGYLKSVTLLTGLSSDEFINYSSDPNNVEFYTNSLLPVNSDINNLWKDAYSYIYQANAVIEGLSNSTGLSASIKTQLGGEAKFLRAYFHFYLVNLWGDVPLITTTDYRINATAYRTSSANVYQQIILDLKGAQSNLADDYSYSNNERVRPNKWAATALLARVYLYTGDWVNAEAQATMIISNTSRYSIVSNLDNVFLKNSNEAIWQLMPVEPGKNTWEGTLFKIQNYVALTNQSVNAFEPGDNRKNSWVNSYTDATGLHYYPYKYKISIDNQPLTEYSMILRLAEQYLIRAEARAQQNNVVGAQADINTIRNRAGLSNTAANDKASLLLAIEHERLVELFSEWGHRWLDLKRTNRTNAILGPLKGTSWQATDVLYAIPQSELLNDPNLTQNAGY